MFKKLRRKIVAVIMSVLMVVFAGTLAVTYIVSYRDVLGENLNMMAQYGESYGHLSDRTPGKSAGGHKNRVEIYGLTSFYAVELAGSGEAHILDNDDSSGLSDEELAALAAQAAGEEEDSGSIGHMLYLVIAAEHGKTVVFMNNTITNDSFTTLLRYMLLFGCCAMVILFFFSWYAAGRMVRPLEEAFRKQKQFVSDASHELKTPLSVVSANADLLARDVGENKWLENIRSENGKMAVLVNQLLQLARMEAEPPLFCEANLSRILTGSVLPFESVAFERGVGLECEIAEGVLVYGNEQQLGQVASILTDNALDHTGADGKVRVELKSSRAQATMRVSNTGCEIPEPQRERIFERFYRLDEARGGQSDHYGLGLSIAKAIIVGHRGSISVDCAGGWTTFTVVLPASGH